LVILRLIILKIRLFYPISFFFRFFYIEPPQKEQVPLPRIIENIYQNIDREYNVKVLIKRLRRIEKNMSGEAREKFAGYISDGDIGRFAGFVKENPEQIEAVKILLERPREPFSSLKMGDDKDASEKELVDLGVDRHSGCPVGGRQCGMGEKCG